MFSISAVAVALAQLDGEALFQRARGDAGRIETLDRREHAFDLGEARAERLRHAGEIAYEVAGIVDHVDQIAADEASRRGLLRDRELLLQMIPK
jgi:hypothetical protein